jgi:hypothetical protein
VNVNRRLYPKSILQREVNAFIHKARQRARAPAGEIAQLVCALFCELIKRICADAAPRRGAGRAGPPGGDESALQADKLRQCVAPGAPA